MTDQELKKLMDKYQAKADRYEHDYMIDGTASQYRTWQRNADMAEALRRALYGIREHRRVVELQYRIRELDAKSDTLADDVERLQAWMEVTGQ